jgi:hypothetical protein
MRHRPLNHVLRFSGVDEERACDSLGRWVSAANASSESPTSTYGSGLMSMSELVPTDTGPILDAVSTVALSMLMDRLRSPALLAHALGPGVLIRRAAALVDRLGAAAVQPAMTLQVS